MRTSRISQETSKIIKALSPSKVISERRTRSSIASPTSFAANATPTTVKTKEEKSDDDNSSLSSAPSDISFDIEDHPPSLPSPIQKRKRGIDSPSTTVTSVSTSITTRTSHRNTGIKDEVEGDKKVKRARRQPAKKVVNHGGEVEIHPPANWEEIYDAVREMRKTALAPVDTMGCETLAEEHLSPKVSKAYCNNIRRKTVADCLQDKRFQTLIALMLSSQTKDTTNAIAMRALQTSLPAPGLTLENILALDPVTLNELIFPVGFHNNKTRYIKATALILRDRFAGDIPDTIEGLMSLPGVGPKMAYLCLSAAWGRTEGIGVDVHVHRITNLWGWHVTKAPEETRAALQAWLPRERWHEINHLLVGFGQTVCLPVGRRCGECTLSGRGLCPSAVVETKRAVKKAKKEKVVQMEVGEGKGVKAEEEMAVVVKEEDVLAEQIS